MEIHVEGVGDGPLERRHHEPLETLTPLQPKTSPDPPIEMPNDPGFPTDQPCALSVLRKGALGSDVDDLIVRRDKRVMSSLSMRMWSSVATPISIRSQAES